MYFSRDVEGLHTGPGSSVGRRSGQFVTSKDADFVEKLGEPGVDDAQMLIMASRLLLQF